MADLTLRADHSLPERDYHPLDLYLAGLGGNDHLIYRVILFGSLITCMMAPVVRIDVFTRAAGIVRPAVENMEIHAPADGFVTSTEVEEGDQVEEGQVVMRLERMGINDRAGLVGQQMRDLENHIRDVRSLIQLGPGSFDVGLGTSKYQLALARLRSDVEIARAKQARLRRDYDRAERLFESSLLSQKDYESVRLSLDESFSEELRLRHDYRRTWIQELDEYTIALQELKMYQIELISSEKLGTIRAPASGTIEDLADVPQGAFVSAGKTLASITRTSDLVGEILLSPYEASGVRPGDDVRFRINSTDVRDWGQVTGEVVRISPDVQVVDGKAVFRVTTSIQQTPSNNGGPIRPLKKGMAFEAHLNIAKKSIIELLTDRLSRWQKPESS